MASILQASFSDPLSPDARQRWTGVEGFLTSQGETLAPTDAGPGLWDAPGWWLVADPTGGSRTVESLPGFASTLPDAPRNHADRRAWWSMSDNTLILDTLLDRGLCRVLHGHSLTLSGRDALAQQGRFLLWSRALKAGGPFPAEAVPGLVSFRGRWTDRFALVGGNLRALERLGSLDRRPKPRGRILLVESLSAPADRAPEQVAALVRDPWWSDIGGLAVGRFSAADRDAPEWFDRCLAQLPAGLPVARLPLVGHGSDAWTVPLGEELAFPLAAVTPA